MLFQSAAKSVKSNKKVVPQSIQYFFILLNFENEQNKNGQFRFYYHDKN